MEATRPVIAILTVDNYDDLMKACSDASRSAVLAQIYEKLDKWAAPAHGLLLKTDRDNYLFIFEEQYYAHFAAEKFSVWTRSGRSPWAMVSMLRCPSAWARTARDWRSSISTPIWRWRWP